MRHRFHLECLRARSGGSLYCANDAQMSPAATQIGGKGRFDFGNGWLRILFKQRGGLHDHSVDTVTALRGLLSDEGLLQRMKFFRASEAFQSEDGLPGNDRERGNTRTYGLSIYVYGTRSALCQAAAESRAVQAEIIAKGVQQRHSRVGRVNCRHVTVYIQGDWAPATLNPKHSLSLLRLNR
jgi:hypothetical protein